MVYPIKEKAIVIKHRFTLAGTTYHRVITEKYSLYHQQRVRITKIKNYALPVSQQLVYFNLELI